MTTGLAPGTPWITRLTRDPCTSKEHHAATTSRLTSQRRVSRPRWAALLRAGRRDTRSISHPGRRQRRRCEQADHGKGYRQRHDYGPQHQVALAAVAGLQVRAAAP